MRYGDNENMAPTWDGRYFALRERIFGVGRDDLAFRQCNVALGPNRYYQVLADVVRTCHRRCNNQHSGAALNHLR